MLSFCCCCWCCCRCCCRCCCFSVIVDAVDVANGDVGIFVVVHFPFLAIVVNVVVVDVCVADVVKKLCIYI